MNRYFILFAKDPAGLLVLTKVSTSAHLNSLIFILWMQKDSRSTKVQARQLKQDWNDFLSFLTSLSSNVAWALLQSQKIWRKSKIWEMNICWCLWILKTCLPHCTSDKLSSTFIYHLNQRPEGTQTVRHIAASKIYVAGIVAVKELLHGDSFYNLWT